MSDNQVDYVICLQKGCEAWRKGDDMDGIAWFQQACILWLNALDNPEYHDLPPAPLHQLAQTLQLLMTTLTDNDIVRATDIIEYDVLPLVEAAE